MKKNLLLAAAATLALAFTAQAEVTYEFLCAGTKTDGTACSYAPNKGVIMTFNAESKAYECELKAVDLSTGSNGPKIVSNDQTIIDAVKAKGLSSAGQWHTQWGLLSTGGIIDLNEDAAPVPVVDFLHHVDETGFTPGEMVFAGGVLKASDVKVKFWPEDGLVKISGTPTAYKNFQLFECTLKADGTVSSSAWKMTFNKVDGEQGIYEGEYDFGDVEKVTYFNIQSSVNGGYPSYGFSKLVDSTHQPFKVCGNTRTEEEGMTQILTPYSRAKQDYRATFGGAADKNTFVLKPAVANVTGKYNLKFDANTGALTMAKVPDIESGVAELAAEAGGEVEFFNMQGMRVANPENGIFIRRQGNKVSKVIVK